MWIAAGAVDAGERPEQARQSPHHSPPPHALPSSMLPAVRAFVLRNFSLLESVSGKVVRAAFVHKNKMFPTVNPS